MLNFNLVNVVWIEKSTITLLNRSVIPQFTNGAFELAIMTILAILASGLLLLWFAEIIRLLQDTKNKLK